MITATPRLAVIASSRMIPISMTSKVRKPTVSDRSAIPPGISSARNAAIAACFALLPLTMFFSTALIICTPWLTPIAKTKNGTRIDMGSRPKPSEVNKPICQMTAITEQAIGKIVSMILREKKYTMSAVMTMAIAKNNTTDFAPVATSPIILAKPMM